MLVLGIDPGTWKTGVGVVDFQKAGLVSRHYETLVLKKDRENLSLAKRLQKLYDNLLQIIKIYQPDVLALENIFYGLNFNSAVRIGEARAVAILAATHFNIAVAEYTPTHIKKAIVGNGQASKTQIQFMVRHLLNLKENPPTDAADALAAAICHCQSLQSKKGAFLEKRIPADRLTGVSHV
jgi:crossover junction endodeoxyribonuclease RuvC